MDNVDNDKNYNHKGTGNNLFPVFVKLEELKLLIVGGGNVGLEKLQTVLRNSPSTTISLVAPRVIPAIRELAEQHPFYPAAGTFLSIRGSGIRRSRHRGSRRPDHQRNRRPRGPGQGWSS